MKEDRFSLNREDNKFNHQIEVEAFWHYAMLNDSQFYSKILIHALYDNKHLDEFVDVLKYEFCPFLEFKILELENFLKENDINGKGTYNYVMRLKTNLIITDRVLKEHYVTGKLKDISRTNNEVKTKPTFKSIFSKIEDYQSIINKLQENHYIRREKELMIWDPPTNGHLTAHKFLSGLYLALKNLNYINKEYRQNDIANCLSIEFNFQLSPQVFGRNLRSADMDNILLDYKTFIPICVK